MIDITRENNSVIFSDQRYRRTEGLSRGLVCMAVAYTDDDVPSSKQAVLSIRDFNECAFSIVNLERKDDVFFKCIVGAQSKEAHYPTTLIVSFYIDAITLSRIPLMHITPEYSSQLQVMVDGFRAHLQELFSDVELG